MPEKQMTPREAIIVLDRLNTDGRIEADREELRAALAVAKEALQKQIPKKAIRTGRWGEFDRLYSSPVYLCPNCRNKLNRYEMSMDRCSCGQALNWEE